MRTQARQFARMLLPRGDRPGALELCECPHCNSRLVHPVRWQVLPDGGISLRLRCPECQSLTEGVFPVGRVRELDRELAAGRSQVKSSYDRTVRRHMYEELQALRTALALDLIGADDFVRPRRRAAPRTTSR
jgi:DNA-directed RNA polymerase subunit RPC12/RpoP